MRLQVGNSFARAEINPDFNLENESKKSVAHVRVDIENQLSLTIQ